MAMRDQNDQRENQAQRSGNSSRENSKHTEGPKPGLREGKTAGEDSGRRWVMRDW